MPELPEVETIRADLSHFVLNKKIKEIKVLNKKIVKNNLIFFKTSLLNHAFQDIQRRGKLLYFKIDNGRYLTLHLKMTGQLVYCDNKSITIGGHANSKKEEERIFLGEKKSFCLPGKYTRVYFKFQDGSYLFFNDLRLFAYCKIVEQEELYIILNKFGIEPLTNNFKLKNFKEIVKRRTTTIKAVILNQHLIAGIGNIYADESLFMAGIRPDRSAQSLNDNEIKKLFNAIQKIIKQAIENRGTTFSDYIDAQGKKGNFRDKLKVYARQGQKCLKCKTAIIQKTKVAGRGTHFCPNCQK